MTEPRSRNRAVKFILGLLISIGSLTALIVMTDGDQILAAMRDVQPALLLLAAGLVILSLATRSFAWRVILQRRISLQKSFLIINAGYFINTILPFRLGEVSRAFLLMPSGFLFWEALPAVALERMLDGLFAVILLLISLPYALHFQVEAGVVYGIGGAVLLGLIALFLLVKNRASVINWLESTPLLGSGLRDRLVPFGRSVLSSMRVLTEPVRLLQVLVGMTLSWGIAIGVQFLLLRAFLPQAELVWAVFALGAVAVGVSVPSSPGNIGLFEASITLALSAFGVDQSLAFTFALTSHAVNLLVTTAFGAYGLYREGIGLRQVWQLRNKDQRGEAL